jgi:hypothetical protein
MKKQGQEEEQSCHGVSLLWGRVWCVVLVVGRFGEVVLSLVLVRLNYFAIFSVFAFLLGIVFPRVQLHASEREHAPMPWHRTLCLPSAFSVRPSLTPIPVCGHLSSFGTLLPPSPLLASPIATVELVTHCNENEPVVGAMKKPFNERFAEFVFRSQPGLHFLRCATTHLAMPVPPLNGFDLLFVHLLNPHEARVVNRAQDAERDALLVSLVYNCPK